jgi:Zn-dependent peptidase ImmA (M78 family)
MNELKIKQRASELRHKFGFTDTEPIRLKSLLLKEKILTCFTPLEDNFSGMAVKVDDNKFILINSNHPIGRQHFTIGYSGSFCATISGFIVPVISV